jgi:thiosulfate/3-mercaptopyruvate sulfurtransferase
MRLQMNEHLLVTTEHLDDDNLRIVDIRGHVLPASEAAPHYFSHRAEYNESHIQGAVFVDWTSDIVEPNSPTYDVANPERYAELMSRLGIADDTLVVAYDDANAMFAARFWWTMRYYGHEAVAVLDGGWQKWLKEKRSVTAEVTQIEEATFTPKPNPTLLATVDNIEQGDFSLIDVRSVAEYTGKTSRAARKGHIPNAINIPRSTLVSSEGIMKSPDELRKMFSSAGIIQGESPTALYCNSGVSASYGLLALSVAGIDNGCVYDSSWKEWGNDEEKPIE